MHKYWLTTSMTKYAKEWCDQVNWPAWHDFNSVDKAINLQINKEKHSFRLSSLELITALDLGKVSQIRKIQQGKEFYVYLFTKTTIIK